MKTVAIILSGGVGKRMGQNVPKQFIEINEKLLLEYAISAFNEHDLIDEIVISAIDGYDDIYNNIKNKYKKITKIVKGGKERQDSVYNALCSIDNCDTVVVHDGVRPLVTEKEIESVVMYAKEKKAVVTAISATDTIKICENDKVVKTLDRASLYQIKTPQAFNYDLLSVVHKNAIKDGFIGTDDASIVEKYNNDVYIVEASSYNIKITNNIDLIFFKSILENAQLEIKA